MTLIRMPCSRSCMGWWFSKHCTLFFFLLLAGLPLACPAGAQTLVGTVVSAGETQFVFRQTPKQGTEEAMPEIQVVFLPASRRGPFSGGPAFPRCVRKGRTVRISGSFDPEKHIFLARTIHGVPGPGKHHDPTGVRARLGRCRHTSGSP